MILFSSFEPQPYSQLEGYCWLGSDLIVGDEGAREYFRRTGHAVEPGADGCYVVVTKRQNDWLVGTDSRGLARLFLYKKEGIWAIGSSFYALVEHLRENKVKLTPNLPILGAFAARRGFADQLTSSSTPFEGIQLLPSFSIAIIGENHVSTAQLEVPSHPSYSESLYNYISTWRSRLSTVMADDDVFLQLDLSGGIDSRTVLSFALNDPIYRENRSALNVVSTRSKARDFQIAGILSDHYGLDIRAGRKVDRKHASQIRSLDAWKQDSLGVYLPLYFHGNYVDTAYTHAHGAGGGNFRRYYAGNSPADQVQRDRKRVRSELHEAWLDATRSTSVALQAARPHVHPLVLHYREFRNRLHFGHRPLHNLVFMPLESILTDSITDRHDGRDSRQLYFDVMESLAPGLKDLPYDIESKQPSDEVLKNLTVVDLDPPEAGTIFGHADRPEPLHDIKNAYAQWIDDSAAALESTAVLDFINEDTFRSASEPVRIFKENGTRSHGHNVDLLNLSFVRAVDFVLTN